MKKKISKPFRYLITGRGGKRKRGGGQILMDRCNQKWNGEKVKKNGENGCVDKLQNDINR